MRVIAGAFRGRKLLSPPDETSRPMTDRVKETIFNILGSRFGSPGELPEVDVLDMFSGTGSMGIEAMSRGAGSCTFVEKDRRVAALLRENLETLGISKVTRIINDNAWTLRPPKPSQGKFGLAFVDPPYPDSQNARRIIELLDRVGPMISPTGVLIFRHEARYELELEELHTLACDDDRRYRKMHVMFLVRRDGDFKPEPHRDARMRRVSYDPLADNDGEE